MSFPRYENYKDSDVEWLGKVPEHWDVAPLKRGFDVRLGKMLQPHSSSKEDELHPYLRAANIQWSGVDTTDIKLMWFKPIEHYQLSLQQGDLLVSEGGDVGRSALWNGELDNCYFQNSLNRVRAQEHNSTRFLYYWISAIKEKGYIDVLCNKSTIAHFTAEKVQAVPVPFPSPVEQQSIAAFLDRETAKIDALIVEQKRLIDLLKEKRQAVISHAVTKGLNPDVPMKDSEIEWLGEVPAHWVVSPIKYHVLIRSGGTPSKQNHAYWDGNIPWASAKDLKTEELLDTKDHITHFAIESKQASLVSIGSVMVVVRGMILAKTFPVTVAGIGMAINQDLKAIEGLNGLDNGFLAWLLRGTAKESMSRADEAGHGTKALRMDDWLSMPITVPPLSEQLSIVDFLSQETKKLDTLTTEAQRAIELLKERRSALISAAVTGKIDVQDYAA